MINFLLRRYNQRFIQCRHSLLVWFAYNFKIFLYSVFIAVLAHRFCPPIKTKLDNLLKNLQYFNVRHPHEVQVKWKCRKIKNKYKLKTLATNDFTMWSVSVCACSWMIFEFDMQYMEMNFFWCLLRVFQDTLIIYLLNWWLFRIG